MLVVRTVEGRTHPLDQFVGTEQAIGFHHPTLAMHPPGLYRVQPRALLGQLAPYDPHAFSALLGCPLLCSSIHRRTSWLMCQEALSHTNTHTFLPIDPSFLEHHERNWVVIALTGGPSTNLSHVLSNSGK